MKTVRSLMLSGVAMAFLLVLYGFIHFTSISMWSRAGAISILLIYAFLAWNGPGRLACEPLLLQTVTRFGLLAGAVFAAEIVLEYIFLPSNNTPYGLVEFGTVLLVYTVVGAFVSFRHLPLRYSPMCGSATAVISSLIWLITVLSCFYLFYGTDRQERVFRAEGNYEDFQRSGMADFPTFIMEDFLGAGFFHLILGPLAGAIFGSIGGILVKGLARLFRK